MQRVFLRPVVADMNKKSLQQHNADTKTSSHKSAAQIDIVAANLQEAGTGEFLPETPHLVTIFWGFAFSHYGPRVFCDIAQKM